MTITGSGPTASQRLERNLRAIGRLSPAAAAAISAATPRSDLELVATADGGWTIVTPQGLLASRHEPIREGRILAETAPIESAASIVVLGVGAGHHVAALASRVRKTGVILAYEPDAALLRLLAERVELAEWIDRTNLVLLTSEDPAAITAATSGLEGLLAAGVKFLDHPASRARLGARAGEFGRSLASVMRAVKTNVVTTLVQVEATLRNLLMNVDRYAAAPGIRELEHCATGCPAVVVSAGPSLERNVDLLARPGVRDRVVIIAAQTVLKKLLGRGITPHFVTALDHHEISRRFYEGLSASDVAGVTLVAEPKANPAIMSAFPGVIRCPGDRILDELLGPALARDMGTMTAGATVAHLAYYLARHMGCDPVIMIGQDLGFTDGQYYHAGAAIHGVWAGELNEFNTLEMLEWQRIVRSRNILHRATDQLVRPIYTDEQMATYLVQFERDFAADAGRGLTTIDATEGGVAKRHSTVMRLEEALERFAHAEKLNLPRTPPAELTPGRRAAVRERIQQVRRDTWNVAQLSRETCSVLQRMIEAGGDQRRIGELIEQVYLLRDRVTTLQPAYGLVSFLNQTGGMKRFQADRAIELAASLTPVEKQRRQIERDIQNVTWIADAADQLGSMLDDTIGMIDGGERITRDPGASAEKAAGSSGPASRGSNRRRVGIVIAAHACPADLLTRPIVHGKTALSLTLERLSLCSGPDATVIMNDRAGAAASQIASLDPGLGRRLDLRWSRFDERAEQWWRRAFRVRRWSEHCWRGGPGNLTIWDELCGPLSLQRVMHEHDLEAAAVIGPQWCAIDPGLVDAAIERHRENPEQNAFAFSTAAPGLGVCVLSRELVDQLAQRQDTARQFATVGGVLGYVPALPRPDPIAKPQCVETAPVLRDAGRRVIADTAASFEVLKRALDTLHDPIAATSPQIVAALNEQAHPVRRVVLDLRHDAAIEGLDRVGAGPAGGIDGAGLTIRVADEQIIDGTLLEASRRAARLGFGVQHVRASLAMDPDRCQPVMRALLAEDHVSVVSVDLDAASRETYAVLRGQDALPAAEANVRGLLRSTRLAAGEGLAAMPTTWIVPRLTRRDEVYEELEAFYDRWLMEAGACIIDPLETPRPGGRITALPRPDWVERADRQSTLTV
ncbi:MAG: hypothetical protein GIKADHBN_02150 [Phycisphaerales bacterium]|nr:hypothetical protein [Phycisphaerales bacterium]